MQINYAFATPRLEVNAWHNSNTLNALSQYVQTILTPNVTQYLPEFWQGEYTYQRAISWIKERDEEGTTLLIIEKDSHDILGFMILHEVDAPTKTYHIGYILAEIAWNQGYATELLIGLIDWAKAHHVMTLIGGVTSENKASIQVLKKCGFVLQKNHSQNEDIFILTL